MKYLQNGGFQNNKLMKLTLLFTLVFLVGFWITNFGLYFAKMGVTPQSVIDYYSGSAEQYRMPRTYQSMLEVTHAHLPMMALVVLFVTHLLIFAPYEAKTKVGFIVGGFTLAFFNESAGWLVRFVSPAFAWFKIFTFLSFQSILGYLLVTLVIYLIRGAAANSKWQAVVHINQQKAKSEV